MLLVYWLAAAAAGPQWFNGARAVAGSWLGWLVLVGFTWALFYHLCNGIRHLFWDIGMGFDLPVARLTGWCVVLAALALTGAGGLGGGPVTGGPAASAAGRPRGGWRFGTSGALAALTRR